MVHYTPSDGMMSRMNDPAQAYRSYLLYGTEKIKGTEEVNGYECIMKVVYQDEKPIASQWFSEELNFPVKMEVHHVEGTYMTLNNIKDWDPIPSIFKVPEDYTEVDKSMRPIIPEPEPPADWKEKEASLPIEMDISRGMMIKVRIEESGYHMLIIENTGDTPIKFIYTSFRDGQEISDDIQGPEGFRTKRLHMEEDFKMTLDWRAGQVVQLKIYEGNARLKIMKE